MVWVDHTTTSKYWARLHSHIKVKSELNTLLEPADLYRGYSILLLLLAFKGVAQLEILQLGVCFSTPCCLQVELLENLYHLSCTTLALIIHYYAYNLFLSPIYSLQGIPTSYYGHSGMLIPVATPHTKARYMQFHAQPNLFQPRPQATPMIFNAFSACTYNS